MFLRKREQTKYYRNLMEERNERLTRALSAGRRLSFNVELVNRSMSGCGRCDTEFP